MEGEEVCFLFFYWFG